MTLLYDISKILVGKEGNVYNWLKSLKERYTWKPSDKQIRALEYYMNVLSCNEDKEVLFGLYKQLKSLI